MFSSGSLTSFALSVVHGFILTLILVAVARMRHTLLWAHAVFVIVALFALFLVVDGLVSGPYISEAGLAFGGGVAALVLVVSRRWRFRGNHKST